MHVALQGPLAHPCARCLAVHAKGLPEQKILLICAEDLVEDAYRQLAVRLNYMDWAGTVVTGEPFAHHYNALDDMLDAGKAITSVAPSSQHGQITKDVLCSVPGGGMCSA